MKIGLVDMDNISKKARFFSEPSVDEIIGIPQKTRGLC